MQTMIFDKDGRPNGLKDKLKGDLKTSDSLDFLKEDNLPSRSEGNLTSESEIPLILTEDSNNNSNENISQNKVNDIINLNPQVIKSENETKEQDKSDYATFGFYVFCILLLMLFAIKERKKWKTQKMLE